MSEELLTAAAMARRLGLPESTTRYYARRYADFLPTAGEGRRRRYRAEALEVLAFVADQNRASVPFDLIEAALADRFPITAIQQQGHNETQSHKLTATTTQQPSLEALRAGLTNQNLELRAELAEVREELAALTAAMKQEQQQQDRKSEARQAELLEAIAAGQKQNGRRWWQVWRR